MKKQLLIIFLLLSVSLFAQLDRSKPPKAAPAPEIKLGNFDKFELPNGLKVFVVENHKIPTVSLSLVLDRDPLMEGNAVGYINIAGQLMRTATKNRTKDQIDQQVDFIGASLSTSSTGIYASSLKKHIDKLLDLMSDVTLNPVFKQEELDKIKKKTLSNLTRTKDDPSTLASRIQRVLYYGKEHPYSQFETEQSVNNITLDLCKEYYNSYFKPNIAYLAIVGDITKKEIQPLIEKYFNSWQKGEVKHFTYPTPEMPMVTKVAIVDRPNAVQSAFRIGYPVDLKIGADDMIKSSVANTILGGGVFRLFKNLREKHSYTYGAYSSLSPDKFTGNFTASADVRNAVTDSAISEVLYEMRRLRNEKVESQELEGIKNYLSGNFAIALERPEQVANFAISIERYNLPKDYYANYLKNVAAVNSDDIQAMAKKYIQPDNTYIIVAGKASEIADKLKKFSSSGQIKYFDAYGEEYDPSVAKAPDGVTAQSILDKYITAIGGKENLLKVKDRTTSMKGSVQGTDISITLYQKAPNKLHQLLSAGPMEQKLFFNGTKAVQSSPMGVQEVTGEQLEEIKIQADMNAELNLAKYGVTSKLTGIEKVDGKEAYKLEMKNASGKTWSEYYDVNSGLRVKQVKSIATQMGEMTNTITFDNYKEVEGVKYPFKLTQEVGPQKIELEVTAVKINSNLADSLFEYSL